MGKGSNQFYMTDTICPGCRKWISLSKVIDQKCPECGHKLSVSEKAVEKAKELQRYRILKNEQKQQERQEEQDIEKDPWPEFEVGSFVIVKHMKKGDETTSEFYVIEKNRKDKSFIGLTVIEDDGKNVPGRFVQKAYGNKVIVLSTKAKTMQNKQIQRVIGKIDNRHVESIQMKYSSYIGRQQYKKMRLRNNPPNRKDNGLQQGNSWNGITLEKGYIKIFRG